MDAFMNIIPNGDKELLFYYKDIILYYENEVKRNSKGFRSQTKKFVDFLRKENLHFIVQQGTIMSPSSYETCEESFVIFKNANGYSRFASFFYHLRNAFAHGRFLKRTIGTGVYILLEDEVKRGSNKGQLSMIAQIPIKKIGELVAIMKESRKQSTDNQS
jgi:hypothetical protein